MDIWSTVGTQMLKYISMNERMKADLLPFLFYVLYCDYRKFPSKVYVFVWFCAGSLISISRWVYSKVTLYYYFFFFFKIGFLFSGSCLGEWQHHLCNHPKPKFRSFYFFNSFSNWVFWFLLFNIFGIHPLSSILSVPAAVQGLITFYLDK